MPDHGAGRRRGRAGHRGALARRGRRALAAGPARPARPTWRAGECRVREHGPVQERGEIFAVQQVGEYVQFTVVAPGIARERQARAVRRGRRRRRELGDAAAPRVRALRRDAGRRLRRHDPVRRRRARRRHALADAAPAPATSSTSSARSATPFPLPVRPVAGGAGRRRLRHGAADPAGAGAARPTARRSRSSSAPRPPAGCSASWWPSGSSARSPSPPTTAAAGEQGLVTDVLPDAIERIGAEVVYACGPMPMLRAVGDVAREHAIRAQVAVEESMACGIGVCMTCVLPVRGDDGAVALRPLLRRRAGVRRRPGALGRRRHAAGRPRRRRRDGRWH